MKTIHRSCRAAQLAAAAVLALLPVLASAQSIYRIVGPDGRVTFSDKPPTSSEKATALSPSGRSAQNGLSVDLPFELREVMSRYPVTLYTGDNCEPCNGGRTLLANRGIPFSEKIIRTPNDVDAFRKFTNELSLPLLTIGGQQLKGFSAGDWDQYLTVAGYPTTSRLPTTYSNPAASPLSPLPEASSGGASANPAPSPQVTPSAPPPSPTPDNPGGIVF